MAKIQQLANLLPHPVLADESYAFAHIQRLGAFEDKGELSAFVKANEMRNTPFLAEPIGDGMYEGNTMLDAGTLKQGSVLVMKLDGPVMPYEHYGIPGLDTFTSILDWALRRAEIEAIVFSLETGGGSAYRLFEFCDKLEAVSAEKPVVSFVSGFCASAGIAISAHTRETYASHATARVGSIGAAHSLIDDVGYWEKMGCKYHYINAPQNPDKNAEMEGIRKGDYTAVTESLRETAEEFHSRVRRLRPNIDASALTGKMYSAAQAEKLGIIDGVATLEQAIYRAAEISQNSKTKAV